MTRNFVVEESDFYLILFSDLIVYEVPLSKAVIMVKLINFFSLSETVFDVLFHIETIHIPEVRQLVYII